MNGGKEAIIERAGFILQQFKFVTAEKERVIWKAALSNVAS